MSFALDAINAGLAVIPCVKKVPDTKIKSVNKVRQKPINSHNAEFYFLDAEQIAILTGSKTECIDCDFKNDLTGKLKSQFLTALKFALPELYEKLYIESTPSGGLHLFYKCHQIGGSKKLAQRPATAKEKETGERVKVLLETKGEGGYVVCYPSPNYGAIQGDLLELQFINPEERKELLAICRSFDLMTSPELGGLTKRQALLPDAPWTVFDRQHNNDWIAETLKNAGWEVVNEDDDRIFVLRPGSSAKTSGWIWKQSNTLYLFSTSTEFEAEKPYSPFSVYCTLSFDGDVKACARHLAEQGIGTWNAEESEFFRINNKNKIEIKHAGILEWMHDLGIRKHWYSQKDFDVVQVLDNVVRVITIDKIKKVFGSYIKETVPEKIYNFFLASLRSIFTKDGLLSQLDDLDESLFINSDTATGWVFFKNGALRVTSFNNELFDYSALEGYVWEKNIISREFQAGPVDGDIKEFIHIIAGKRREVELMFITALGYLLHPYKDPVNPKVPILNDEFFDENESEPEGGTGKGLFIKILQQFKTVYSVDGKSFSLDKSFPFQGVSHDTELFAIEDAKKGFDFERIFSVITEGMTVEKKGKDEFKIPYDRSPKILITTNYAIKGSSSSHKRRRYELEIAPVFSNKHTPIDYFGHRFFIDWDADQWSRFDNYMVYCLQTFLNTGLAEQVDINLQRKKLIQETNRDFINWITDYHKRGLPEKPVAKQDFKGTFCIDFPDYANKLSTNTFTRWVQRWAQSNSVSVDASNKHPIKTGGLGGKEDLVMCYKFSGRLKAIESYEVLKNGRSQNPVNGRSYEVSHAQSSQTYEPVISEDDLF